MAVIQGGQVNTAGQGVTTPGAKPRVLYANGVPTDANLTSAAVPANGDLAVNVLTGDVYERAAGVWTRRDTI
jgi:hypothetical protein